MKLFVTVAEATADDAIAAIRRIASNHDGVEVRAEHFRGAALAPFRAATAKPLLFTVRGAGPIGSSEIARALDAGFDLVDVEWAPSLAIEALTPFRERIVLSHHDYEGMRDIAVITQKMLAFHCRHVKIAATPDTLRDNLALLELAAPGTSVIGMGERGIYSRIGAPFLGAELTFVSPDEASVAAPGQLTLERALAIFGAEREPRDVRYLFAVAGNPASHSLSPSIHNPLFRERGVAAAYTIASAASFAEVAELIDGAVLAGVSVTAPFKEEALRWAVDHGFRIGEHARLCGAANTLVGGPRPLADNTDVDGFAAILERLGNGRVAIVGAGGTARAALIAARLCGLEAVIFSRSSERTVPLERDFGIRCEPLGALPGSAASILIDTTPSADFDLSFRSAMTYIRAAYGAPSPIEDRARAAGAVVIDGRELLFAQAVRQNEIFVQAIQ